MKKYNCKIHEEVEEDGKLWRIVSADKDIFLDRNWTVRGSVRPAGGLEHWRKILSSDLGLVNHKKIKHNDKDYYIISLWRSVGNGEALNWDGLFNHSNGQKYYDDIVKNENATMNYGSKLWYIIPIEDYMCDNVVIIDDDQSYTAGYKAGHTGLRWL